MKLKTTLKVIAVATAFSAGHAWAQNFVVNQLEIQSLLQHSVVVSQGSTGAATSAAPGAAGTLLGSNGTSADPSFQTPANLTLPVVVTTIANLRLVSKATYGYVYVLGYYAQGDGGGGLYFYNSSDTTSTDNGGTIIVGNDGGRWYLTWHGAYTARQFGVKADGATNDYPALANAIAALPSTGGVVDCRDCAIIAVASTVTLGNGTSGVSSTINGAKLLGNGSVGPFLSGDIGTTLKWVGAPGGTVVHVAGPSSGNGLIGDWCIDGNGSAAQGLLIHDNNCCQYGNIRVKGCTGVYLTIGSQNAAGGSRANHFESYVTDTVPNGGTGMLIDGGSLGFVFNNHFKYVEIPHNGAGAVCQQLGYTDFNVFDICVFDVQTTLTTSVGVSFVGHSTNFPSWNKWGTFANSSGFSVNTTNGVPCGNYIETYDLSDSQGITPNVTGLFGYASTVVGGIPVMKPFGFYSNGISISTPGVPASGAGNAVTNTNPQTVDIYMNTSGGLVQSVHILDRSGNDTNIGSTSLARVGPGQKIYFGGTVPSSWVWYASTV